MQARRCDEIGKYGAGMAGIVKDTDLAICPWRVDYFKLKEVWGQYCMVVVSPTTKSYCTCPVHAGTGG